MQYLDFGTIFFLITAVVIIYQLRSVLGRRTGNERQPFDPYTEGRLENQPAQDDNVVALPRRKKKGDGDEADEFYAPVDVVAEKGTPLNKSLREIRDADPNFDPKGFVEGAKLAYEMIVTAYAEGDRKALRNLLSRDVFEGFDRAIAAREKAGESMRSSFVGISRAEIINADLRGSDAMVTLRIVSEMISATMDANGEVVDGDPESVTEGTDIWTFSRDLRSRDPNWKLVATEEE
ncbi:calcium-binding protein [Zhengella mangrovi]|uniref:Calcium-binding protein n=1 Tax=Zhengella mangrovi TaxID=1982044 RepID=A0A2G1QT07_9HYPH|nr:Tim44/TimA family putative adaptor protein [Zhengella mangrovi]PHP68622.1 calcium-binding protein [Zhengella mangrovi]